MFSATTNPLMAMKYKAEVGIAGKLELQVPLAAGDRVVVFVIPESAESFQDLAAAAQSSLDFWDNPLDDEDWNDVDETHEELKSSLVDHPAASFDKSPR